MANGIAYINTDLAIVGWLKKRSRLIMLFYYYIHFYSFQIGNYSYQALASPLLHDLMYDVTKHIYIENDVTVYDRWYVNEPKGLNPNIISHIGSGSDHSNFLQRAGIPCIDNRIVRSSVSYILFS